MKRIGKEVDRLSGDEGATLGEERPCEYEDGYIVSDIVYLRRLPQRQIASGLGLSERAWRSIAKGTSRPRFGTGQAIKKLADQRRERR